MTGPSCLFGSKSTSNHNVWYLNLKNTFSCFFFLLELKIGIKNISFAKQKSDHTFFYWMVFGGCDHWYIFFSKKKRHHLRRLPKKVWESNQDQNCSFFLSNQDSTTLTLHNSLLLLEIVSVVVDTGQKRSSLTCNFMDFTPPWGTTKRWHCF